MTRRKLTLFVLYFFMIVSLMSYQSIKGPFEFLFYFRYPLLYLHDAVSFIAGTIKRPFVAMFVLGKENENLKTQVNELKMKEQQCSESLLENERLRAALSLKDTIGSYVAYARVIAMNPDKWSNILIIDKGRKDGVYKNMAVRTADGLLGKTQRSNAHHSTVLLITDINSSVAVKLQKSRRQGILSGTGTAVCDLKFVPYEEEVSVGEVVLTSGLDGIFPADIPVGKVRSLGKEQTRLFQTIEVVLAVDPKRVEEVMIVGRVAEGHRYEP